MAMPNINLIDDKVQLFYDSLNPSKLDVDLGKAIGYAVEGIEDALNENEKLKLNKDHKHLNTCIKEKTFTHKAFMSCLCYFFYDFPVSLDLYNQNHSITNLTNFLSCFDYALVEENRDEHFCRHVESIKNFLKNYPKKEPFNSLSFEVHEQNMRISLGLLNPNDTINTEESLTQSEHKNASRWYDSLWKPVAVVGWLIALYFLLDRLIVEDFFERKFSIDVYDYFHNIFYATSIIILSLIAFVRKGRNGLLELIIYVIAIAVSFMWLFKSVLGYHFSSAYYQLFFAGLFFSNIVLFWLNKDILTTYLTEEKFKKSLLFANSILLLLIGILTCYKIYYYSPVTQTLNYSWGTEDIIYSTGNGKLPCAYYEDRFLSQRSYYVGLWKFDCNDAEYIEIQDSDPIIVNVVNNKLKISACGTIGSITYQKTEQERLMLYFDVNEYLPNMYLDDIDKQDMKRHFASLFYNDETDEVEIIWRGMYDQTKGKFLLQSLGLFGSKTSGDELGPNTSSQTLVRCK
jgi:hypothetical protein